MPRAFYDITERPTAIGRAGRQAGRPAGTGSKPRVAQTCGNHATAVIRTYIPPLSLSLSLTIRYFQYGATHATRVGEGVKSALMECRSARRETRDGREGKRREEREKIETRPEIAFRRSTTQYMPGELFHAPNRARAPALALSKPPKLRRFDCLNTWDWDRAHAHTRQSYNGHNNEGLGRVYRVSKKVATPEKECTSKGTLFSPLFHFQCNILLNDPVYREVKKGW